MALRSLAFLFLPCPQQLLPLSPARPLSSLCLRNGLCQTGSSFLSPESVFISRAHKPRNGSQKPAMQPIADMVMLLHLLNVPFPGQQLQSHKGMGAGALLPKRTWLGVPGQFRLLSSLSPLPGPRFP